MSVKNVIYQLLTKLYPTGRAWNDARNFRPLENAVGYGYLYNFPATQLTGFAPEGWHFPTKEEMDTLVSFVGGASVAGGKLKDEGIEYWTSGNTGTDDYDFSMTGSGARGGTGSFLALNLQSLLYALDGVSARSYTFEYQLDTISSGANTGKAGLSVRLIKDDDVNENGLIDYNGNRYDTVTIGTQVWIAQNWACTKLNDGTPIANLTDNSEWSADTEGAYCAYNNDASNAFYSDGIERSKSELTYNARKENYEVIDNDVDKILDQLIPDNNNFTEDDVINWERQYGINNSNLTLEERYEVILARRTYPNGKLYRQTGAFIQEQLRANGFDVYVHENRFDNAGVFNPINPISSIYGGFNYGAQAYGVEGYKYETLLANYIDQEIDEANAPGIFGRENNIFFVGGPTLPEIADIDPIRVDEFKHLILSLKPTQSSAQLLIDINNIRYGYLYDFTVANNVNFAPAGWRFPTKADFDELMFSIGGLSLAGKKLKEQGPRHWDGINDQLDTYNFSARGAGVRTSTGSYVELKKFEVFLANDVGSAWTYTLQDNADTVNSAAASPSFAYSVRLIKDDSTNPGTLTDYDGNVYDTHKIGNQVWTKQNWACTKLNEGTPITHYAYDDDITNAIKY